MTAKTVKIQVNKPLFCFLLMESFCSK